MISFSGKKKVKKNNAEGSQNEHSTGKRATRHRVNSLRRLLNAVKIGGRIRYHKEYEGESILETLIIGYRINDLFVYRQADIDFIEEDDLPTVVINTAEGRKKLSRIEAIQLIVPGAIGEEKKLDYDSRANLGRRGPFAPKANLVVMTTNFDGEHLRLETEVHRNLKLTEGVHKGLQVALLTVMLGTLDTHEPRQHTRVSANIAVTLCKNGKETVMPAQLIDFSEKSIRLALDSADDRWPEFSKKDFALVGIKSALDKPLVKLKCQCIKERGEERIFEMTHIVRHGKTTPMEMIDALEIKIDLMNLQSNDSV